MRCFGMGKAWTRHLDIYVRRATLTLITDASFFQTSVKLYNSTYQAYDLSLGVAERLNFF